MRINWLYLASRSDRDSDPVFDQLMQYRVDGIILASITSDMVMPACANQLQHRLGADFPGQPVDPGRHRRVDVAVGQAADGGRRADAL